MIGPSGRIKSPGERLHRLVSAQWLSYAPVAEDGDWSALSDTARQGWEDIARSFVAAAHVTEASGREYCVRDRATGRIVVAWRPVDEVVAAVEAFGVSSEAAEENRKWPDARVMQRADRLRIHALLGLEPAANADDVN